MKTRALVLIAAVTPLAAVSLSTARAGEIRILFADGKEATVELLSVRDSAIVISRIPQNGEVASRIDPDLVTLVPFGKIDRIRVEGKSYVVTGLLLGAAGGAVIGGIIGGSQKTESEERNDISLMFIAPVEHGANTLTGVLIGGLGGLLLGAAIGGGASSPEAIIDPGNTGSIEQLRAEARYPRKEPEFLKTAAARD